MSLAEQLKEALFIDSEYRKSINFDRSIEFEKALNETNGYPPAAAKLLGISDTTLKNHIKKYYPWLKRLIRSKFEVKNNFTKDQVEIALLSVEAPYIIKKTCQLLDCSSQNALVCYIERDNYLLTILETKQMLEKCPKNEPKFTVKQVAEALQINNGDIQRTSLYLECSYATIQRYIKVYPELDSVVNKRIKISSPISIDGNTKLCSKCGQWKPIEHFKKSAGENRFLPWCNECTAENNYKNTQWYIDFKSQRECICCGYDRHHSTLEFNHINPLEKLFTIGDAVRNNKIPKDLIIQEMGKCMIICRNCHAILHSLEREGKRKNKVLDILDFINSERILSNLMPLNNFQEMFVVYKEIREEWTLEECNILKTEGPLHNLEELRDKFLPNKTESSIKGKLKALNVRFINYKSKWTSETISLLGIRTDQEISEIIGLSTSTVQQKRKNLGIPAVYEDKKTWDDGKKKIYKLWRTLQKTCSDKDLEFYDDWKNDFEIFYDYIGCRPEGKSLYLVDKYKGYMPNNLAWGTIAERNRLNGKGNISFNKKTNKWHVGFNYFGKNLYVGSYESFEEAVQVRSDFVLDYNNNIEKLNNTEKSNYLGVCFGRSKNKWRARIYFNGKNHSIGDYNTPLDAAIARNKFCEEHDMLDRVTNINPKISEIMISKIYPHKI